MTTHKTIAEQTIVVILAAGKGARMGRNDLAKVCFEIDSVPAINRLITAFKKQRFRKFLIVVGSKTKHVLKTTNKEHPGLMYVYQEPQLGTGHAAKIASEALQTIGFDGNVLVTMGDKFIEEAAIESLVGGYIKQQADLALLTIPKLKSVRGSEGKVLLDQTGQVLDIIEKPDLARQAIADELRQHLANNKNITTRRILRVINKHISEPKKQAVVAADFILLTKKKKTLEKRELAKILQSEEYNLRINGKKYSARQIEKNCKEINPSLYLFRADAFYQGVGMINNDNAQAEYYLTDIVKHLASIKDEQARSKFKVRSVRINAPEWIQGFNSPDDLLAIQDYVRRKKKRREKSVAVTSQPLLKRNQYCTVSDWLSKIKEQKPGLKRWLRNIYGQHENLHEQKCKDLTSVLMCYGKKFGYDEKVCIIRAPGRLNLMGRHVDHRGGFNNFLAINRETIAVAGVRKDNNVVAVNTEPRKFKPIRFNISELIGRFAWSDWLNFINSDWVRNMLHSTAGDWGNYIKAAMLRLQNQYQDIKLNGVNLAICGNVPIAAGLSSSSTIVVATLQAAIALNNFELTSQQFIDLCGEGEWFVGSRGGAGDHAAIYLGQRGKIARVGYLPFRLEKIIDAPQDFEVIIANSHIKAAKSSSAKNTFNAKVASYNLGLALLKQRCPEIAGMVEYVRDLNPDKLGCSTSDIYRMLLKIPQSMTRKDFRTMLSSEHNEIIETNFSTHSEPKYYNVRGVLLFGAAEIARSRICMDYVESGRLEQFGTLMNVSHNGDRVSRPGREDRYTIIEADCSDEYLNKLITDLASEDPDKVLKAQMYIQPGSYGCSTVQIDQMVDIACSVPGVVGSQIAGAGLGGCIMIVAKKGCTDAVRRALVKQYYRPNRLKPAVIPCIMVEGAGLAEF